MLVIASAALPNSGSDSGGGDTAPDDSGSSGSDDSSGSDGSKSDSGNVAPDDSGSSGSDDSSGDTGNADNDDDGSSTGNADNDDDGSSTGNADNDDDGSSTGNADNDDDGSSTGNADNDDDGSSTGNADNDDDGSSETDDDTDGDGTDGTDDTTDGSDDGNETEPGDDDETEEPPEDGNETEPGDDEETDKEEDRDTSSSGGGGNLRRIVDIILDPKDLEAELSDDEVVLGDTVEVKGKVESDTSENVEIRYNDRKVADFTAKGKFSKTFTADRAGKNTVTVETDFETIELPLQVSEGVKITSVDYPSIVNPDEKFQICVKTEKASDPEVTLRKDMVEIDQKVGNSVCFEQSVDSGYHQYEVVAEAGRSSDSKAFTIRSGEMLTSQVSKKVPGANMGLLERIGKMLTIYV